VYERFLHDRLPLESWIGAGGRVVLIGDGESSAGYRRVLFSRVSGIELSCLGTHARIRCVFSSPLRSKQGTQCFLTPTRLLPRSSSLLFGMWSSQDLAKTPSLFATAHALYAQGPRRIRRCCGFFGCCSCSCPCHLPWPSTGAQTTWEDVHQLCETLKELPWGKGQPDAHDLRALLTRYHQFSAANCALASLVWLFCNGMYSMYITIACCTVSGLLPMFEWADVTLEEGWRISKIYSGIRLQNASSMVCCCRSC